MRSKKSFSGFTLIELVCVMLMASALAVSAGNLLSTTVFDERWLYEDMISAARHAQILAETRGCAVLFTVGSVADSTDESVSRSVSNSSSVSNSVASSAVYSLKYDVNCRQEGTASFTGNVIRPDTSFSHSDIPADLSISSASVVFYPEGWACDAGGRESSTVSISIVGVSNRTLNIECGTGFVYGS